jgi:hypothetical protein
MMISMSASHQIAQVHRLRISQAMSLSINIAQLQHRRDLIGALHGETFSPKARCPMCDHPLTDYEIMKGFRDDPRDYTTGCPKCKHRFLPQLHHSSGVGGSVELAFFCPVQTLDQLPQLVNVPLDDLRTHHAAVYYSAVAHFGGLKQAFGKLGLTYAHEADLDWKNRVGNFLGKMPDTVIAQLVGAPVKQIQKLRREKGVPVYSRAAEAKSLKEAEAAKEKENTP